MGRTYCALERRKFNDVEFARAPRGVTVHVLAADDGHTTDGWPATFRAEGNGDQGWTVSDVEIHRPDLDVAADEAPEEDR
ncbi:hypothetical protein LG324_09320 [Phycicoccus jejuensis]|uniref:hypothetical protein n=1 Tax=Phycicoccus jejuensis TaxID=367299 RepID=UPI0004C31EA6|nr:hypothetical protein [Phycicoccus jejuensis]